MKTIFFTILLFLCFGSVAQEINPYSTTRKRGKTVRKCEVKELRKLGKKARIRLNDTLAADFEEIPNRETFVVRDHRGRLVKHKKARLFRSKNGLIAVSDSGIAGIIGNTQVTDTGTAAMPDSIKMFEGNPNEAIYGKEIYFDFQSTANTYPMLGQRARGLMVLDSTMCARFATNELLLTHVQAGIAAFRATINLNGMDPFIDEIRIERGIGRDYSRTNHPGTAMFRFNQAYKNENTFDFKVHVSARNLGGLANLFSIGRFPGKDINGFLVGSAHISSFFGYCIAHEWGHTVGAKHTQSCDWFNPATGLIGRIDSCASGEGVQCSFVTRRNDNGHFMSYCHNNGRINMSVVNPLIATVMRRGLLGSTVPGPKPPACTSWSYSPWSTCQFGTPTSISGLQARTATCISPAGGEGTPQQLLIQSCSVPCTTKTYSPWGPCTNGWQTRTVVSRSPLNCSVGWPTDTLMRPCTITPCATFTWSDWTPANCQPGTTQTRTATGIPSGCQLSIPASEYSRPCPTPVSSVVIPYTLTTTGTTHSGIPANIQDGSRNTRWVTKGPSTLNLDLGQNRTIDSLIIESGFLSNGNWTSPIRSMRITIGTQVWTAPLAVFRRAIPIGVSSRQIRIEGLDTDFCRWVEVLVKGR